MVVDPAETSTSYNPRTKVPGAATTLVPGRASEVLVSRTRYFVNGAVFAFVALAVATSPLGTLASLPAALDEDEDEDDDDDDDVGSNLRTTVFLAMSMVAEAMVPASNTM